MSDDCLFCKIVAGDIPADVVQSTDRAVAFRDINPQAPTHVLVIPRSHHANAAELAAAEPDTVAHLVDVAAGVAAEDGVEDYRLVFNTGAGRRADRVPHAPAPARRPPDDLAAGLIRATRAGTSTCVSTGSRNTARSSSATATWDFLRRSSIDANSSQAPSADAAVESDPLAVARHQGRLPRLHRRLLAVRVGPVLVHATPSSYLNSPRVRRRWPFACQHGDMRSGRLRVIVAAAAILPRPDAVAAGDDGHTSAEPDDRHARPPPATATARTARPPNRCKARPLREGERRLTLEMPEPYTPSAPTGVGTDDYRCFLLDPKLDEDALDHRHQRAARQPRRRAPRHPVPGPAATWSRRPSRRTRRRRARAGPASAAPASARSRASTTPRGWAPGRPAAASRCYGAGFGVELEQGLADRDAGALQPARRRRARTSPPPSCGWRPRTPTSPTSAPCCCPAPVELPCRPGHDDGPLCDRDAAVADVKKRFGDGAGLDRRPALLPVRRQAASRRRPVLHPHDPRADDDPWASPGTCTCSAARSRSRSTPAPTGAQTVLDIPVWDFDNQGAKPIKPVHLDTGDTVKVTCRHAQCAARPAARPSRARTERYVVWGEGTTDEMCLGILLVTQP